MPNPEKPIPALSHAEWDVMKTLWEKGQPMAARDVDAALSKRRDWSVKTAKTLLSRLVAKGALEFHQVGNSYLYRPAISREEATMKEARGFAQRVLDGADGTLLAHFLERADLDNAEIEKLKSILNRKNRKPRKRRSQKRIEDA